MKMSATHFTHPAYKQFWGVALKINFFIISIVTDGKKN